MDYFGIPKALIFLNKSGRSSHARILRTLEIKWVFNRYGKYALQSRYYNESDEELEEDADGSDEDNVNRVMVGEVD